jgi:tetratricopeptide (TPR) repeat protein
VTNPGEVGVGRAFHGIGGRYQLAKGSVHDRNRRLAKRALKSEAARGAVDNRNSIPDSDQGPNGQRKGDNLNLFHQLRRQLRKTASNVRSSMQGLREGGADSTQAPPPPVPEPRPLPEQQPLPMEPAQPVAATPEPVSHEAALPVSQESAAPVSHDAAEPVLQESQHSAEAETVQAAAEQHTAESGEHGPNDWAGYRSAAAALREQKSLGESEALLRQAVERFPNESDVFRDLATLSQQRRDWEAAEQWWQKCLALVPDAPYACTGLAVALRQQGCVAEAEALLVATQERLPGHPAAFEEYARVADANKDWTEAQRRWSALRERFPNHLGGYRGLATVLGEQGLFDNAEALLLQAAERWPDHRSVYQDLARLAERRKDWAAAEKWGQKFLALTPDLWWAYTGLAGTLRQQGRIAEAEGVLVAGQDRLPGEPSVFEQYARLAETSKDWQEAQRRWAAFRERFPLHWSGYYGGAAALREQGLLDDAEALLLQAAERLPNEISTVRELARLAEQRRDWPAAEQWWRRFLAMTADPASAYVRIAATLRLQTRIADAEAVLREAMDRLPNEPSIREEYAHLAEVAKDWEEAQRRWMAFREQFPNHSAGYRGSALVLRETGQLDAAEALLLQAVDRFPNDGGPHHDLALLAQRRGDWATAERWWRSCVALMPNIWWTYTSLAAVVRRQGREDEARSLLLDAQTRFPTVQPVTAALTAMDREHPA